MPVEQAADDPAMGLDLFPGEVMDEGLINRGPESGQQDVQFRWLYIVPAQATPLGLRQIGAGGLRQKLHPVVGEVGVPGSLGAGEQQIEVVSPVVEETEPPYHVRPIHVPRLDQFLVGHGRGVLIPPGMGHFVQVRNRLFHHRTEQLLLSLVALIQRSCGDSGPLADGLKGRFFKAACQELCSGALQDPGINGAVRHCHAIASLEDN